MVSVFFSHRVSCYKHSHFTNWNIVIQLLLTPSAPQLVCLGRKRNCESQLSCQRKCTTECVFVSKPLFQHIIFIWLTWLVSVFSLLLFKQRKSWFCYLTVCEYVSIVSVINAYIISSGENKTWRKFRPVCKLNTWPLQYHAVPCQLS